MPAEVLNVEPATHVAPQGPQTALRASYAVLEASATASETYTAANIRIMAESEAVDRFDFAMVGALAKRYPDTAPEFVDRMVQSCRLSGWPVALAERRYLIGDRTISPPDEFVEAHREQLQELRRRAYRDLERARARHD